MSACDRYSEEWPPAIKIGDHSAKAGRRSARRAPVVRFV